MIISDRMVRLLLVFTLFLLLSPCIVRDVRAADTTIEVEPQEISAQVGETFNITIRVVDVQNLYGVQVFLQWNQSILNATRSYARLGVEDYPDGVLHKEIFTVADKINQTIGTYLIAGASLGASFNGTGTVAIITFNVTREGSSDLKIDVEKTQLADGVISGHAIPIDYTAVNGFFGPRTQPTEGFDWNSILIPAAIAVTILILATVLIYAIRRRTRGGSAGSVKSKKLIRMQAATAAHSLSDRTEPVSFL